MNCFLPIVEHELNEKLVQKVEISDRQIDHWYAEEKERMRRVDEVGKAPNRKILSVSKELMLQVFHLLDIVDETVQSEEQVKVSTYAALCLKVKFISGMHRPDFHVPPDLREKVKKEEQIIFGKAKYNVFFTSIGEWIHIVQKRFNGIAKAVNIATEKTLVTELGWEHCQLAIDLAFRHVCLTKLNEYNTPRAVALSSLGLCLLLYGLVAPETVQVTRSDHAMWKQAVDNLRNELFHPVGMPTEAPVGMFLDILAYAGKCISSVLCYNTLMMLSTLTMSESQMSSVSAPTVQEIKSLHEGEVLSPESETTGTPGSFSLSGGSEGSGEMGKRQIGSGETGSGAQNVTQRKERSVDHGQSKKGKQLMRSREGEESIVEKGSKTWKPLKEVQKRAAHEQEIEPQSEEGMPVGELTDSQE